MDLTESEKQRMENIRLVKEHGWGEINIVIRNGEVFEEHYKFTVRDLVGQEKLFQHKY